MSVKLVNMSVKHSKLARAFACGGNFKKKFWKIALVFFIVVI